MRNPLLAATLLLAGQTLAAQPRGIDLFGRVLSGNLTKTSGTTELRWLPSGEYLETVPEGAGRTFYRVDPSSERRRPLLDRRITVPLFADFEYGSDGRTMRLFGEKGQWLLDTATGRVRPLAQPSATGPLDLETTNPGAYSPDFRYFAFIRDYDNLFLLDTETGQEQRLTTGTSEDNTIGFLGATPWFVWSPDSRFVAYLKADQSQVPAYPFLRSLTTPASVETMRYPFTTAPNPDLSLWVVDIATHRHRKVAQGTKEMPYLRDLTWWPNSRLLAFQVVSEFENRLELRAYDLQTEQTTTLLVDEDQAYLDPPNNFRILSDGQRFLFSSEQSGWRHLYLHRRDGGQPLQLTSGSWVTEQVLQVNERAGWVYFVGFLERGLERHLFRVKLDGTGLTRLTPEPGTHLASVDPTGRFFTDDFSSLGTARTVRLRRSDGTLVRTLARTAVDSVAALGLAAPELLRLRTADGTAEMHGILFRPVGFDSSKRYPLVVNVYGGPHTKSVRDAYQTTDFRAALAQLGFLVAEFDGRGTRLAEKSFQIGNYLRLGQEDVDDQAAGVRQLAQRYYVDASRVGVTGLSHGGFMTLMMMLRYPEVYHVAAAGAPLTDLTLGPRQYIGRVMRTPEANPEGYAKANLLTRAGDLKGRLLIYQGTNDRSAVLGNTLQLVKRFVELGRPVDMMIYPDGVHVLEGSDAVHQLKTTVSYFLEHLRPESWEASRAALWR